MGGAHQGFNFGRTIAIGDGVVAVAAHQHDQDTETFDKVFLFEASTGLLIAKLYGESGYPLDDFGVALAIGSGVLAVGASTDEDNGWHSGAVYLFDASTGARITKLHASDGVQGDFFGGSVSISNGVVAVGAHRARNNGIQTGSAYLFDASTGVQIAKLVPSDAESGNSFGASVSIENGTVAAGSYLDNDNGIQSGSAYLFTVPGADCQADLNGDGIVDTRDFIAFLGAWANNDPLADWNDDGIIDTRDFIAFLADWAAGC